MRTGSSAHLKCKPSLAWPPAVYSRQRQRLRAPVQAEAQQTGDDLSEPKQRQPSRAVKSRARTRTAQNGHRDIGQKPPVVADDIDGSSDL
jgi:hypothetical protein